MVSKSHIELKPISTINGLGANYFEATTALQISWNISCNISSANTFETFFFNQIWSWIEQMLATRIRIPLTHPHYVDVLWEMGAMRESDLQKV